MKSSRPIIPTSYSTLFGLQEAVKDQSEGLGWSNFMLGRWSPKWQQVQKQYLTSFRSRKSSLRWAASIIHKLLMTVWNIWDFRNNINQGKNGIEYVRKKRERCKTIQEEYTKGTTGLLPSAHHLIYSYYRKTLFESPPGKQRDWIHSVQQARVDFQNGFVRPPVVPKEKRNLLVDWLNSEADDILTELPTRRQIACTIPIVSGRRY